MSEQEMMISSELDWRSLDGMSSFQQGNNDIAFYTAMLFSVLQAQMSPLPLVHAKTPQSWTALDSEVIRRRILDLQGKSTIVEGGSLEITAVGSSLIEGAELLDRVESIYGREVAIEMTQRVLVELARKGKTPTAEMMQELLYQRMDKVVAGALGDDD